MSSLITHVVVRNVAVMMKICPELGNVFVVAVANAMRVSIETCA